MIRVFRKISCLVTNSGLAAIDGRRPEEKHLGIIRNAALVFHETRGVLWVGEDQDLPAKFRKYKSKNLKGYTGYPSLVDPHSHPVFAGNRAHEFELRMRGASYQEIAQAGGGILYSMEQTRNADSKQLISALLHRLKNHYDFGVSLMEAKSGYGLNHAAEIASLVALRDVGKKFSAIKIRPTCLAAHAFPPEAKLSAEARNKYLSLILEKIIPEVSKKKLAHAVDVFCDAGYFSLEESKKVLLAGKKHGLRLRVHGEELAETGAASLAAELGADSVDHLLKVSDRGIRDLSQSNTTGILLPATSLYLREPPAPARRLIDAGVRIALATDFNPGSSPTQNLPFVGSLAAIQLGMSTAEIIAAITWNAAKSLGEEKEYGTLLPGNKAPPIFVEGEHPSSLFYWLAPARVMRF